jgi:hypothetical protein
MCQQRSCKQTRLNYYANVHVSLRFKQGSFQSAALAVLKQRDVRALDLRPDSPQFRQLKSFFKGVSVTLVHRPGLKKIRGLVPNAGNFEFENTTVKVGFDVNYIHNDFSHSECRTISRKLGVAE